MFPYLTIFDIMDILTLYSYRHWKICMLTVQCWLLKESHFWEWPISWENSQALDKSNTKSRASMPNPQFKTESCASFQATFTLIRAPTPSNSLRSSSYSQAAQLATTATTACSDLTMVDLENIFNWLTTRVTSRVNSFNTCIPFILKTLFISHF